MSEKDANVSNASGNFPVFGILGMVFFLLGGASWLLWMVVDILGLVLFLSIFCEIAALIFGIIGYKRDKKRGLSYLILFFSSFVLVWDFFYWYAQSWDFTF